MINWFIKRRREKETFRLESLLVEKLSSFYPDMADIRKQAKIGTILPMITPQPCLQIFHMINGPYMEKNRKRHSKSYLLNGVELCRKNSGEFIGIPVEVTWDLISKIDIDRPFDFWKHYSIESIRVNNLSRVDLKINNEDEKTLRKILKSIDPDQINKLEIEDTFEIELENKKFYVILNMEDGNSIAVNKKGEVYRLNHDSYDQARLIEKSVSNFLKDYSGNKAELEKFFQD